jgi:hypothetical protein
MLPPPARASFASWMYVQSTPNLQHCPRHKATIEVWEGKNKVGKVKDGKGNLKVVFIWLEKEEEA